MTVGVLANALARPLASGTAMLITPKSVLGLVLLVGGVVTLVLVVRHRPRRGNGWSIQAPPAAPPHAGGGHGAPPPAGTMVTDHPVDPPATPPTGPDRPFIGRARVPVIR